MTAYLVTFQPGIGRAPVVVEADEVRRDAGLTSAAEAQGRLYERRYRGSAWSVG